MLATPQYVCLYNPSAYRERKREGCCDAVVWNGHERDVLEYFAAQYRSWLRRLAQRYVNHEIARIAARIRSQKVCKFRFSSPSRSLRFIYQPERRAMASDASDRDTRNVRFFVSTIYWKARRGYFPLCWAWSARTEKD